MTDRERIATAQRETDTEQGERIEGAINLGEQFRSGRSVNFWPHEDGSLNPLKQSATLIIHAEQTGEVDDG